MHAHAHRTRAASRRVSPENFPPVASSMSSSIGFETSVSQYSSPLDVASRLLPPICLAERRSRAPCSGPSSPTSSASPKRKRSSHTMRQLARARPCKSSECPIVRGSGASIFDAVPWASALQAAPAPELLQPWNIGDLSLLPSAREPRTRTGPIRSRKSSLRSAPFPDFAEITPELTPARVGAQDDSPLELPFTSFCGRRLAFDDVPRTPPPRASRLPVDAGFRNLMPIAFADL